MRKEVSPLLAVQPVVDRSDSEESTHEETEEDPAAIECRPKIKIKITLRPKATMDPGTRIQRLATSANTFNVDRNQPIRRYYRSGHEMLRMGDTYYREDDTEKAYVLYLKFLTLFLEKIREHPEFKTVLPQEKKRISGQVKDVMDKSEKLKQILKEKYQKDYEIWLQREEERRRNEEEELKRKKAKEEARRREEVARYNDEQKKAVALQRDYEAALLNKLQWDHEQKLEEEERRALEEALKRSKESAAADIIPHTPLPSSPGAPLQPQFDRDSKPIAPSAPPPESVATPTPGLPPVIPDRSSKPSSSSLYTSSGLRKLRIPSAVMSKFLSIARSNTDKNVETCAILAGRMAKDQFTITNVIVPKQKGTSDSCTMVSDDELFEYQFSHELLTLGWIHTHPSQTAFLSSVDLHNHYGYQVMLPEAIAIVCAPKYNETGFFSLTANYGLDFIGKCREKGFHPHPSEPPLFEEGSHVELDSSVDVNLVDLR